MNEVDFTGRYKDKIMHQFPKANLPHLKRIINQQVFLEESDPYVYGDPRKNMYAIDAAQHMLSPGMYGGPVDLASFQVIPQTLPQLDGGAGPSNSTMFSLPKQQSALPQQLQGPNSLGPLSGNPMFNNPPTSYMTQGQYSRHPIFHT